jgi:primosomal replication protein N''
VRDRYVVQRDDGTQAVLTLYHHGAEPDPAVYDVLRRLPREHVPEVLGSGRWNDRAYEVSEFLGGGALADVGLVAADLGSIRHIVSELGRALHAMTEVGLRHRDIRPSTLLVRGRDPLDLVISGFGSARLSEFDLDLVSPLEVTRYMAPEAVAGGVAAASDWWSLGMVLLEQITRGKCFEGINERAFLIHVLAHGVSVPADLDASLDLLLRGLLARDRHERWQWPQVRAWLANEPVSAPPRAAPSAENTSAPAIVLGGRAFRQPAAFALAASDAARWSEAVDLLNRGAVATWANELGLGPTLGAGLRRIVQQGGLDDNARLMLALKRLNPDIPLIHRGDIVTPGWLLDHPLEGYALISGAVPDVLDELGTETWLSALKRRESAVRGRATQMGVVLDEEAVRIYALSSSRAKLSAEWDERRRRFPESTHAGLQSIAERTASNDVDLIVLLSAPLSLFRSAVAILEEAQAAMTAHGGAVFDAVAAQDHLELPRRELLQRLDERLAGFARCGVPPWDSWADEFRVQRRLTLARALVLLAANNWQEPQKQQYVSQLLAFFEKRIATAVMRGPLVRMTIGSSTARVDLSELGTSRVSAENLLDHLLQRGSSSVAIDPTAFAPQTSVEGRLQALARHTLLYKRDTGIDGLYLGFPFLLARDDRTAVKTRIAPLLLWPVRILAEVGRRGSVALSFDNDREEVRLNPALEGLLGPDATVRWRRAADELLGRSSIRAAEVMNAFGLLAAARHEALRPIPGPHTELPLRSVALDCAAALFHVTFSGQAVGEDLRALKALSPVGTGLESALRLGSARDAGPAEVALEANRFFTVSSDPSQEQAVLQARSAPGLVVEGPPGTGKSQTIVNMVGDAIGRDQTLLIICQKHAALDVVHKRLVAEGLGDRIVLVNDVNRDRAPILRAVREQLERLHARGADPSAVLRPRREAVAARIDALEGDLDSQHQALHAVDPRVGLSYRTLLGELIELEDQGPVLDVPALRPVLHQLSTSALASLEEEVAPLTRLWLPAEFENSALDVLLDFATDAASLADVEAAFETFRELERRRTDVLLHQPAPFEVDDPAPHRTWLAAYGATFLHLRDPQRKLLARWLPFFRASDAEPASGKRMLDDLGAWVGALQALPAGHDPTLSPVLADVAPAELARWVRDAGEASAPAAWWQRLNPGRWLRGRSVRRFLTQHGGTATAERIVTLERAGRLEQAWAPLRASLIAVQRRLQLPLASSNAGPTLVRDAVVGVKLLREVGAWADALAIAPWSSKLDTAAMAGTAEAFTRLVADFDAAFARFEVRRASALGLQPLASWFSPEWMDACATAVAAHEPNQTRIEPVAAAWSTLAAFQHFRSRARRLSSAALGVFAVLRTKQESLSALPVATLEREMRRVLQREARLGWKRAMEQAQPDLQLELSEVQSKVESLAALDTEMRGMNRTLLGLVPSADVKPVRDWEDITRLTGQRARRLREFIEHGKPLGLLKLRPVWLMNPDVASRVLPLKPGFFDTVIYDEASQMPVEHALPTLFRGKVTVVSGDEKQMPPTAFFSSKVESDEAEVFDGEEPDAEATEEERDAHADTWNRREIKDCPDLLQLAKTTLTRAPLLIHYRSQYRELIAYSNASFYANELSVPVRHPEATVREKRPIDVIRVDGVYVNQTNPEEAARVVDYLAQLWRQPSEKRPSVGVVTFNRKQADLIEALLEARAEEDAPFREAFRAERERTEEGEDMGVFVKNVENVQGDERDVMVFSSTFGRNAQGTFRRAFGVLGHKGGERRLNVAVTRAREKIVMITSMPVADISDLLATHRAPATPRDFLQGYMEYARAVSAGEFTTAGALLRRMALGADSKAKRMVEREDDAFAQSVKCYVESLGWTLTKTVEQDAFGLDFAIEDSRTGLFGIGIECDAPRHPLLARARAREVWRPGVLRNAVGAVHRVSSHAWYHTAERERERLRIAIEAALGRRGAAA